MPGSPLLLRFLLLWRHAASRVFQGSRGLVLLLVCALPVVLAWLQKTYDRQVTVVDFFGAMLMLGFQIIVPLVGLFLGTAVLGDEIEGRTLTYLYTRPQPRPVVFLARYAGLATVVTCLILVSVAATGHLFSSRVLLTGREILGTAGVAALGFLVYAAFFAMLRLFVQRALFIGFILTFIFEGFISKIPDSGVSRCTVWHHLALLESRLLAVTPGEMAKLLRGISPDETVAGSLWTLCGILFVSLAVGVWRVWAQETRLANAST